MLWSFLDSQVLKAEYQLLGNIVNLEYANVITSALPDLGIVGKFTVFIV